MSNILLPKPALGTPIAKGQLLSKGLVANFPFSDGRGDILSDFSLEKNHGTLVGPTWVGNALSFNGTSDYVNIPYSDSLKHDYITVGAWVMRTGAGTGEPQAMSMDDGAGNRNWQLRLDDPRFLIFISGAAKNVGAVVTINLNQWYFLVGTFDGTTIRCYLDGVQIAETAQTGVIDKDNANLNLGRMTTNHELEGNIKGAIFYNRALSASEIAALYLNPNLPMQQPPIWLFTSPVVSVNPKGPLGHPLHGPFAGPIAC